MKKPYSSKFFLVVDYYLLTQLEKEFPIDISDFIILTYLVFTCTQSGSVTLTNKVISGHTRVKIYSVRKAIINLEGWGLIEVDTQRDYSHNFKENRIIKLTDNLQKYKLYDDYKDQKMKSPDAKTHSGPGCENASHISN